MIAFVDITNAEHCKKGISANNLQTVDGELGSDVDHALPQSFQSTV